MKAYLLNSSRAGFLSGVPRQVKSLILILSLNTLAVGYFIVFLTAYLPQEGISSGLIGTIIGAEGITMVVVGIPLGLLSDKKGRKWILTFSAAGLSPVLFILASREILPFWFSPALLLEWQKAVFFLR